MLFKVDSSWRCGQLVTDFCWEKLHKKVSAKNNRDLKIDRAILKVIHDRTGS